MVASPVDAVINRAGDRAREDPAFAEALAALADAPTSGEGRYASTGARAINRPRVSDARREFEQTTLTAAQVRDALGTRTTQAVHRLRSRGRLIGVTIHNRTRFPAWQLSDGRLRNDLPELLALLGRFATDPIAADRIMRLRRSELGDRSIAEALDDPVARKTAWSMLSELGA